MVDKIIRLKDKDGNIVYPLSRGVAADSIGTAALQDDSVTTSKIADSSITTSKIADGSVTSDKIDWSTLLHTYTDSNGRTALVFGDGTMICTRVVNITNLNLTTAWGSLYYGLNPDYYTFSPASAPDFVSMPIVTITPTANGTRSFWMGAWNNGDPSNINASNRWAIPLGSIMFLRPTSQTSVSIRLHVTAIGRWKA